MKTDGWKSKLTAFDAELVKMVESLTGKPCEPKNGGNHYFIEVDYEKHNDPQGLKDLCESIKAEPGIFQRTSDPVERQDGRAGYNSRERRSEAAVR